MSSLQGKVVVVTGAASGIGRSTAARLAAQGALLSLADINAVDLDKVRDELLRANAAPDSAILTRAVDIRSREQCSAWIRDTVEHFGQPIAGAANLAGVVGRSLGAETTGSIRSITDAEFDWVVDVNMKGTLNCLRAELPHMLEGTKGRGGGAIVNAASIAGLVGVLYNAPYVAAKHAVVGLTRTAAKEEGPRAIRVNAIAPGIVQTPMLEGIQSLQGEDAAAQLFGDQAPGALARVGDAKEAADVVIFLLSPQSSFVNGVVVPVEGGWIC